MKLSAAIAKLQELLAKEGDLELKSYNEFGVLRETKDVRTIEAVKPRDARFTT